MTITEILQQAVARSASDVLLIAGLPVTYKVDGVLRREGDPLSAQDCGQLTQALYQLAGDRELSRLEQGGDDDFSFSLPGLSRFRVNALRQRGSLALVIRVISFRLPDRAALHIPDNVMRFADCPRGLVLFTGPAGSGKTTTLACIVDAVNSSRNANIITIEDPIEYLHRHKKSVVIQRELAVDTRSYQMALRAALREIPDIILLGEIRDPETTQAAITAAETGHLVISTLHTVGAANSIDRIVDSFPPVQQSYIRVQLSMVLEGVVSQQLLPSRSGERLPAFEVMVINSAIRNMIRESKSHQLDGMIAQSGAEGMVTMDQSILKLVQSGQVSPEDALRYCVNPDWLRKRMAM
ncbi:type IV pilus twitching motility protein PilT [uncultured Oscillibacter sp.]|uniref:type IV pilus twitching motility protein PilT n=1 Tax=uncultured Oscillibacter sp. TaxID=876091 RepID=UPI0025F096ED|nr:PilT/PilU family type 4a pilus ATPase [uncultured Oscillibacter sp.]